MRTIKKRRRFARRTVIDGVACRLMYEESMSLKRIASTIHANARRVRAAIVAAGGIIREMRSSPLRAPSRATLGVFSLWSNPDLTPQQIADQVGLTRKRVYQVLQSAPPHVRFVRAVAQATRTYHVEGGDLSVVMQYAAQAVQHVVQASQG